jgi:hypothetical protein
MIMRNMIIGSERKERVDDGHPFYHQRALTELDQEPVEFVAFIAMH